MSEHVSIIIPTYDRAELLRTRSLPSVLAQTYADFDVQVIGDGSPPEVEEAVRSLGDSRISFVRRERYQYPEGDLDAWHISGSACTIYGLDHAPGPLVCVLADDDEYRPEFLTKMAAKLETCDICFCVSEVIHPDGHLLGYLGCEFPPRFAGQSGGEWMWRANLIRPDLECWRKNLPNDWDYHSRMIASGLRVGWLKEALYIYRPQRHIPPCHPNLP